MTREEAINHIKTVSKMAIDNGYTSDIVDASAMAIEALEQEPCGDCISRKDLLKKCVYTPIAPVIKGDSVHYEDIVFARDIINAEPIQQEPKTGWIPVSERLPEENGRYLVTMRYSTHDTIMAVGYTNNLYEVDEYDFVDCKRSGWYGYDSEYGFFEHDNVVAWMPLPKQYKGSEE